MFRFVLNFFGMIFSALVLAVIFGAITIGGIFWVYSRDLPDTQVLANYQPATTSRIYDAEGRTIDEFARERRFFTPIEEIPDVVKQAFISAEDKNFYTHSGYDIRGIGAALVEGIRSRGQNLRGASTIPQQVAKISFLDGTRSVERKVKEAILANRMVKTLGREKILEIYLNEIDLGYLSFGVASAARTYFNKSLSDLTPQEAAYLAALPKAPYDYHPVDNLEAAVTRRNYVLSEMYDNGFLTKTEYDTARYAPLLSVQNGNYASFNQERPPRNYFTDEIRRQLSSDFGEGEFFTGGFSVRATVDPQMQRAAERALRRGLENYDRNQGKWRGTGEVIASADLEAWQEALADVSVARDIEGWFPAVVLGVSDAGAQLGIEGVGEAEVPAKDLGWTGKPMSAQLARGDVVHVRRMTSDSDGSFIRWTLRQVPEVQGAFVAMDVDTGRVIAMQGGFSYQFSDFNRATQAKRQPGSSFKPFVYAAALDSGYTPATIVVDGPIKINTPDGVWQPKNASNQFYGPTPLRTGIEQSRNLMTIRLAQEVGMGPVATYAERFGVYDNMGRYLANSLGSQETTLYKMVAAYAMFANGGERVEPTLVDRVQDRFGATVYRHDKRGCVDCMDPNLSAGRGPEIVSHRERVIDPITAYQLTSMMQGVVQRGSGKRVSLPVPVAGKTGTTNDAKDVWFVGFTSNIVAGCFMGFDDPRSLGRSAFGGTLCAPVFDDFMDVAVAKFGGSKFPVPPGGTFIKIDRFTGDRLSDDASGDNVIAEYFRDGELPEFGIQLDGGFEIAEDYELVPEVKPETAASDVVRDTVKLGTEVQSAPRKDTQVKTSTGKTVKVPERASFGTLSTGGLY